MNNIDNITNNKVYTIGEFAKLIGVTPTTLNRWAKSGKLIPCRTITNKKYYTDKHLAVYYGTNS